MVLKAKAILRQIESGSLHMDAGLEFRYAKKPCEDSGSKDWSVLRTPFVASCRSRCRPPGRSGFALPSRRRLSRSTGSLQSMALRSNTCPKRRGAPTGTWTASRRAAHSIRALCFEMAGVDGAKRQLHATVRGRVQGVGFRYFVAFEARRLGLYGYVRNGRDGRSVEVVAEGRSKALEALLDGLRTGPPGAQVAAVQAAWREMAGEFPDFSIRA